MGKRIYSLQGIRRCYSYDVEEICALYKKQRLHAQTVRAWIREGLRTIDKGRPTLIYGNDLCMFLGELNTKHKVKTQLYELLCMKCKDARPPYLKQISLEHENKYVKMKALCSVCQTKMNKSCKLEDIPRLREKFKVVEVLELYDSTTPPSNTHLEAYNKDAICEHQQWELF